MDLYIDYDAYGNSMPEDENKVSLPEGEAYKNWYTFSQLANIDLSFNDVLHTPGSLQSHMRLSRESPPQSEPKEAAEPEEQFSASGRDSDEDDEDQDEEEEEKEEEEDDDEEEDANNLFSQYPPRLTNSQPNLPGRTSLTLDPSTHRWRRSPMPSYHPSYMHNGYPPEAPTVSTPTPTPIPSPTPSPTPSPAPVTLNHHTQTGRVTGPIPRPFGRTSCEKHRKLHRRCTCDPEGNIDPNKAARPRRKGPTKRSG